jgi:hypothetical protein
MCLASQSASRTIACSQTACCSSSQPPLSLQLQMLLLLLTVQTQMAAYLKML